MSGGGRVGWLDCSSGVSGDMLLGALSDLGALEGLPALIASLAGLGVSLESEAVSRQGLAAVACRVSAPTAQPTRGLPEVLAIVEQAEVPAAVRARASAIFRRLAAVEGAIHQVDPKQVHFHEVGAVDSVVDVLGGCLGLHALGLDALVVSSIALGGGTVRAAHGVLPVPTPAALGLLTGSRLASHGGPVDVELATPTGIALAAQWATASGPMPSLAVQAVGVGAGQRDLPERANVVRLVIGTAVPSPSTDAAVPWQVIEANVDDLDPRLWPGVIAHLLAAGAADAWLTPILMKKGRPAHTVAALVEPTAVEAVQRVLLTETSTIGVRATAVSKHALERSWVTVDIDGQSVRVKLAHDSGQRVNLSPEYDDVAAAAAALAQPAKDILARATAAALSQLD
jgi:pyridinium-3,5-bisthiocarboxylic acid mononucleotide nickel chelatase